MFEGDYSYRRIRLNWLFLGLASLGIVLALIALLRRQSAIPAGIKTDLLVYCAAGIRKPIEAAAKQYETEYPVRVRLDYGSSGELESKLFLERKSGMARCDLYIPADQFFSERAKQKGLTKESIALAHQRVVVAIKRDSPDFLFGSVRELLDKGLPYVLCDEQAGAGRKTKSQLEKHGLWVRTFQNKRISLPRVPEAASALKASDVIDAAMIWDSTARQFGLKIVECPELRGNSATVSADVVSTTIQPQAALHFARYLAAPEKGNPFFRQHYFGKLSGDLWKETPELRIDCCAFYQKAIAKSLAEFEAREDCILKMHSADCITLVAKIRSGKVPDVFMACDVNCLREVEADFFDARKVSSTGLVILVKRGNEAIRGLEDLAKPNIQLGVDKSVIKSMHPLFQKSGLILNSNFSIQSNPNWIIASSDEILAKMDGQSQLDAALLFEVHCQNLTDHLQLIPIENEAAKVVQHIAVRRESKFPQLIARLLSSILSPSSREHFLDNGFQWEAGGE